MLRSGGGSGMRRRRRQDGCMLIFTNKARGGGGLGGEHSGGTWWCGGGGSGGGGGRSRSLIFLEQPLEREVDRLFLQMMARVCGGGGGVPSPLIELIVGQERKGPT